MGNVYALIPTRKSWILILEHWFPPCPIPQAESNLPSYFDVYFTLWSTNIFKIFIFNSCHVSLLEGKLLRICSIYRLGLGYNPLITSLEPCRCQTKAGSKLGWYIYITTSTITWFDVEIDAHIKHTHTHLYKWCISTYHEHTKLDGFLLNISPVLASPKLLCKRTLFRQKTLLPRCSKMFPKCEIYVGIYQLYKYIYISTI